MSRILAIDLGEQRIGLALSDPTGQIAGAIRTIQRGLRDEEMAAIGAVLVAEGVTRVIVGMPLGMNGQPGVQAELTRRWVEALRRHTDLPIEVADERLTSVQAHRSLDGMGVRRRQHRQHVDAVAATLLLQGYLDGHREDA